MIKNALLLGGSGFVGTWIANRLSQMGVRVTIPTRRRERNKANIMLPTVEVVEANINDQATLLELMRDQDVVINLVGILHDHDSQLPYGKRFGAAHAELLVTLSGIRDMSLEQSIEWIDEDEWIEITPESVRVRKKVLPLNLSRVKRSERID